MFVFLTQSFFIGTLDLKDILTDVNRHDTNKHKKIETFCPESLGGTVLGPTESQSGTQVRQMTVVPDSEIFVRALPSVRSAQWSGGHCCLRGPGGRDPASVFGIYRTPDRRAGHLGRTGRRPIDRSLRNRRKDRLFGARDLRRVPGRRGRRGSE